MCVYIGLLAVLMLCLSVRLNLPLCPRPGSVRDVVAAVSLSPSVLEEGAGATRSPWVALRSQCAPMGSVRSKFSSLSCPRAIQTCISKEQQPADK